MYINTLNNFSPKCWYSVRGWTILLFDSACKRAFRTLNENIHDSMKSLIYTLP